MNRDDYPLFTGLLAYFPHALSEVARCSKVGNEQHNAGEPLHWARHKSTAHADLCRRYEGMSLGAFLRKTEKDAEYKYSLARAA